MTVGELIEKLSRFEGSRLVEIEYYDSKWGSWDTDHFSGDVLLDIDSGNVILTM